MSAGLKSATENQQRRNCRRRASSLLAQTPSVRQQHQTWSKLLQGIGGPQAVGVLAARLASVRLFLLGRASRRQGCESQQLAPHCRHNCGYISHSRHYAVV